MRASIGKEKGAKLELVTDREIPKVVKANDVLIRVKSAAVNPVDYKMLDWGILVNEWPAVFGCDIAGVIEKVGEKAAEKWKVGDKVWTLTNLLDNNSSGFCEFSLVDAEWLQKIPDDWSFDQASTLPCGYITAGVMLQTAVKEAEGIKSVLVYGASSSVGMYCVQIAKLQGYKVIGICSARNAELVKSLGADKVVDYHDSDWKEQAIKALGEDSKAVALDAISSQSTMYDCSTIVKACKGNSVAGTDPEGYKGEGGEIPEGVEITGVFVGVMYSSEQVGKMAKKYIEDFPELVAKGFKENPFTVVGGLDALENAFDQLRNGKVSGKKLVIKVEE